METQTYANHRRFVPLYHGVLFFLLLATLIGSVVNLFQSLGDHQRLYSASLIVVLVICVLMLFFFCRIFALKAQDRAIRAEENLRHFVLTGKLLDAKLGVLQIVALRFAPDTEFVALARRAADENMAPDAIKRAIKQWKPDTYRV
jgi:small-conductance mechanosensitive channel